MKDNKKYKTELLFPKGFTLIELMMTIAIIGALGGLILVNFPGSQQRARDTQRKSDLKQYQTALERYANGNNGLYPSRNAATGQPASSVLCPDLNVFLNPDLVCPEDPKGTPVYLYQSNGTGLASLTATQYVLWAALEKKDGTTTYYFVVCSNGRSGRTPNTTTFSAGGCPATLIP